MLRFFRINDPYRLFFIFLVLLLIRVIQSHFIGSASFMEVKWLALGQWLGEDFRIYREAFDYTGPLAAFVYKYLDLIFGRSILVHRIASTLLIIYQAGVFNRLLLKNKAYDENGYLPAFMYVIVITSVPDFMALSPQLMSLTFILLTFSNVLKRIDNLATDELFLSSGIYIGVATMIYLPAFVFLVIFLMALTLFSTAILRRLMLYLFGFLLVFGLCCTYFYWRGDITYFLSYFLVQGLMLTADHLLSTSEIFIIVAALLGVFVLSVFKTFFSARLTIFQQKIQQVLWLMFFATIACFMLTNKKAGLELILLTPVIAYFLTFYFLLLKKRFFIWIMPGMIVFGLIGFSLYAYDQLVKQLEVEPTATIYEDEKVMVLGENLDYYSTAKAYSPTFDITISRKAWEGLDYYESASSIYKMLEKGDADIIVDRMEIVPSIFSRYPLIRNKYRQDSDDRYRKISN